MKLMRLLPTKLLLLIFTFCATALAADHGVTIVVSRIYLSADPTSAKLGDLERGRELAILENSHEWLHVLAIMGPARAPEFPDDQEATHDVSGWILGKGIIRASTPNGDQILYGAAADAESEASRRGGRKGAAQDAMRLYARAAEYFPKSPLAGEALYRAADIRWQLDREDVMSRPSAKMKESFLRQGMKEDAMREVIKKFPHTKWADLAAFHLIENKLCGDWQGSSQCPTKEAEFYEKYAREHPESPAASEALYNAAWRFSALIEIYKTENQAKRSAEAKDRAARVAQEIVSKYPQTDWAPRAQSLLYMLQQGIPTYGNSTQ